MNILALVDIELWMYKACITIYEFAANVYELIIKLAENLYMEDGVIADFASTFEALVGVFMLFKIALSIINYLVDPDKIDDKKVGSGSLIVGIIVTLGMLILYRQGFQLLRNVQGWIIEDNLIQQIFGAQEATEVEEIKNGFYCTYHDITITQTNPYNGAANSFDYNSVTIAFETNNSQLSIEGQDSNALSGISINTKNSVFRRKVDDKITTFLIYKPRLMDSTKTFSTCPAYIDFSADPAPRLNIYEQIPAGKTGQAISQKDLTYINDPGRTMAGMMLFSFIDCDANTSQDKCKGYETIVEKNDFHGLATYFKDGEEEGKGMEIAGGGFLPLIFGVALILFLIVTTVDVAIRSLKLMILELFAPIPIICYAEPKSREIFSNWIKMVGTVYFDIFLRLIIIAIVNFILAGLKGFNYDTVTNIILIFGLLLFVKEAPQFICKMLGIKDTGSLKGFTLNPFARAAEVPILGGVMGATGMALGTLAGKGRSAKDVFSAMGQGFKANGGFSGATPGDNKNRVPGIMGMGFSEARKAQNKGYKEKTNRNADSDAIRGMYGMMRESKGSGGVSDSSTSPTLQQTPTRDIESKPSNSSSRIILPNTSGSSPSNVRSESGESYIVPRNDDARRAHDSYQETRDKYGEYDSRTQATEKEWNKHKNNI